MVLLRSSGFQDPVLVRAEQDIAAGREVRLAPAMPCFTPACSDTRQPLFQGKCSTAPFCQQHFEALQGGSF